MISGEIDGADPDGGDRRRGSRGYWRGHQRDRAGGPASEPASGNTAAASDWKPQFFNDREWAFINAAVARLIPADELGPGAKEAGVPEFIDRQLNTPYATGSIWYMQGPFNPDVPKEMGYQLPLVPKQIYNLGIADAEAWCQDKYHKTFAELSSEQQDEALGLWESGKAEFKQLPASLFFTYLLQNTREGFFSDPIHGGNKGMVGWTLINFPARAPTLWTGLNGANATPSRRYQLMGRGRNHGHRIEKNRCRDRRLRLGWGDHGQRADRSGAQRRRAGARPDARHGRTAPIRR